MITSDSTSPYLAYLQEFPAEPRTLQPSKWEFGIYLDLNAVKVKRQRMKPGLIIKGN
jgi:hypothetical protein